MKKVVSKIEIHPLLPVFASVMIALGYADQFFILVISVALHETAHILLALLRYNIVPSKIRVVPIGQISIFNDIDRLSSISRVAIHLSGVAANIAVGILLYGVSDLPGLNKDIVFMAAYTNIMLGLVNLIPAFPFDGGSILHTLLGNKLGINNANAVMQKSGAIFCAAVYCLGFVYVVLYPFNINVICIGIYFSLINKEERGNMIAAHYRNILRKTDGAKYINDLPVKLCVTSYTTKTKYLVDTLCWDYYYVFFLLDDKNVSCHTVTETTLINYTLTCDDDPYVKDLLL